MILKKVLGFVFLVFYSFAHLFAQKNISYFHDLKDTVTVENTHELVYLPFDKEIYQGLKNGSFWFKIVPVDQDKNYSLTIPYANVTRVSLYLNKEEIREEATTRFPTFLIKRGDRSQTYFLHVFCNKEGRISIEIIERQQQILEELNNRLSIGLYYGLVFCVFVINLFLFFNSGTKTYLYYSLFLIAISLTMSFGDGLIRLMFGNNLITEKLEPLFFILMLSTCAPFAINYLQLSEHLPNHRLTKISVLFIVLGMFSYLGYIISDNFYLFILTELIPLAGLGLLWGTAVRLFNKSIYARFCTFGYGVMMLLAINRYAFSYLGIRIFELTPSQFRLTGLLDVFVFLYAISYQVKTFSIESNKMKKELEKYLYQNLLLKSEVEKVNVIDTLIKEHALSFREIEVLKLIANGKTNKEIAEILFLSINTVKYHIKSLFIKLKVSKRKDAADLLIN